MDFEDDVVEEQPVRDCDLIELSELANIQLELEHERDRLERELKEVELKLNKVSGVDIPTAMDQIGMSDFLLKSGERITVKRKVKASISKANKELAHKWLRENEFGDLIKNNVTATFGRGEDEKANNLLKELDANGYVVQKKESVHGQSLSAFVREQMARGAELPTDLLGVFEYSETKINKPK